MQAHWPWFFGLFAHSGGILVLLASSGVIWRSLTTLWRRVWLATALGALVNVVGGPIYFGHGPLVRDVVAFVVIGVLCALTMGAAIWFLGRRRPRLGVWCAGLVLIAFVGITPYAMFFVHCTSGYCI
jgi:hypothetical protein